MFNRPNDVVIMMATYRTSIVWIKVNKTFTYIVLQRVTNSGCENTAVKR